MRDLLLLAAGVWIGRAIYKRLYDDHMKRKNAEAKQTLLEFIDKRWPALSIEELRTKVYKSLS